MVYFGIFIYIYIYLGIYIVVRYSILLHPPEYVKSIFAGTHLFNNGVKIPHPVYPLTILSFFINYSQGFIDKYIEDLYIFYLKNVISLLYKPWSN